MLSVWDAVMEVSLGVVELLKPGPDTSLGALVLICSPAEGTSNLLILLAEADLTLSVTITCVTNFAAIGMLPLWTILFETRIYDEPGNVEIPFTDAFIIFGYIVASLTLGFVFHRKCPVKYHHFWTYLPSFTIFTIVFSIIVEVYNANYIFSLISTEIFFTGVALVMAGFFFGAVIAFLSRQTHSRILVLAIESGTRTTYFTTALIVMSLPQPEADIAKSAPVLVGFLSLLPTFVLVCLYRMYRRYKGQAYGDPNYAPPSSCSDEDMEEDQNMYNEDGMLEDYNMSDDYKDEGGEKCLPIMEVVDVKETCI